MPSTVVIALVAVAAGLSCALCGVFLVLRRAAMMADAISHSVLPGLVLGYVVANGPNILSGLVFATGAGLLTVSLVEMLTRSRRVSQDSAIGLVFPSLFALGVFVISKYLSNVHIDTDAVLYGEIATAPFDTLSIGGRDFGPQSLWVLGGLAVLNAIVITAFYKELKISTFDPDHAATIGLRPAAVDLGLMALVAVTTVGAFSAVGAILAVALIVAPPVTASLLTRKLPVLIGLTLLIGVAAALAGYGLAAVWDVSISGMIATTLGVGFGLTLVAAPEKGVVAHWVRLRRQSSQFAVDMLVMHLASHIGTQQEAEESTLLHVERELGWRGDRAASTADRAVRLGLIRLRDGAMSLTPDGLTSAARLTAEIG